METPRAGSMMPAGAPTPEVFPGSGLGAVLVTIALAFVTALLLVIVLV